MPKALLVVIASAIAVAPAAAGQAVPAVPAELARLVERARLSGPVTAWCRGDLQAGRTGAFAAAVSAAVGGGRYVVLHADGSVTDLAAFTRQPDLACYSRARAQELNRALARSETIQGGIAPRWGTTVICGFVEDTSAVCWQYSPAARAFVRVGGWTT